MNDVFDKISGILRPTSGLRALGKTPLAHKAGNLEISKHVSISDDVHIAFARRNNFTRTRAAVIAHWDPDNIVDDYVLNYLEQLRGLGYSPILASASRPELTDGLRAAADALVYRTCGGYDFTSWKAAFTAFPSLYEAEEALLTNDSIFAPVGSFDHVYSVMDKIACDYWGMIESLEIRPHLQSYYLALRQKALSSEAFSRFIDSVDTDSSRTHVIDYETSFSAWLESHGLVGGVYAPARCFPITAVSPVHYFWKKCLLNYKIPVIKRDLVFRRLGRGNGYPLKIMARLGYRTDLALEYYKRSSGKIEYSRIESKGLFGKTLSSLKKFGLKYTFQRILAYIFY